MAIWGLIAIFLTFGIKVAVELAALVGAASDCREFVEAEGDCWDAIADDDVSIPPLYIVPRQM